MTTFTERFHDWITQLLIWLSDPEDSVQTKQWQEMAYLLAYPYHFTDNEYPLIERVVEMYVEHFHYKQTMGIPRMPTEEEIDEKKEPIAKEPDYELLLRMEELLNREQVEQRTPEWYKQMTDVISASELGSLYAAPRQRAQLVMTKTIPYQPRNQSLAVPSDRMSAFDWGIRFEPVVKQIYIQKYGVTIKELGRLHHPIDNKCTASPDGLIYSCPHQERMGRLIEIKCPVSRKINGTVPKEYYHQMQMQLHVTGMTSCDYVEAKFASPYNQVPIQEGPALYKGWIALIRYKEIQQGQEFYYAYSPVDPDPNWTPSLGEEEEIVERIPWELREWHEQRIMRSDAWWEDIQPMFAAFWEDVEKARRGEFNVPESTRPAKKPKLEPCMIQFTKVDEKGEPLDS